MLVKLRAAYEEQRQDHTKSMARFLERIACLCEDSGTHVNPSSLAGAVRGLAVPSCKVEDNAERAEKVQSSFQTSLAFRTNTQPQGGELEDPFCRQDSVKKVETFNESSDEIEDIAQRKHGFSVPRLPFIDAQGTISPSDSPASHGLGHRLRRSDQLPALPSLFLQPMTGRFAEFVNGNVFKAISALVIMLNYYYIVYQTDFKMTHLHEKEPASMFVIEVCFTVFYVWELTCQILSQRKDFLLGEEKLWNVFDLAIVLVSIFELVMTLMGGTAINLSFLRVLRFLKISRVLRMFSALRLMKEIRIMVDALSGSFLIFIFCSIMLAMFFSIFAIFFVQGATTYLENSPDVDQKVLGYIKDDFGTVSTTMLSLFMSVTGGNDWAQYHETIAAVGTTYNFLFLFFIGFSSIAFLNVITGVFAEKALSLASPSANEMMMRRKEKEARDAKELVALLNRVLGSDGQSAICIQSFGRFLEHPDVVQYFEVRGLKPCSASHFFTLLAEIQQTETVDFGTLVSACVKLDGMASSMDLQVLSAELKSMQMQHNHLGQFLKENLGKIISHVEVQSGDHSLPVCGVSCARECDPLRVTPQANLCSRTTADHLFRKMQDYEDTPSAGSAMTTIAPESNFGCGSLQEMEDADALAVDSSALDGDLVRPAPLPSIHFEL